MADKGHLRFFAQRDNKCRAFSLFMATRGVCREK